MKKNILFILPDQMRADFLGFSGASFAKTPNLDKLASESVVYNNAISPSPICVPARASMLTGDNAVKNGVINNTSWIRPDHQACGITTWPKILSDEGYHTVGIGKMHFYPWDNNEGFDKRIISEDKRHTLIEDDYHDHLQANGLKKYHGLDCEGYVENKGSFDNPFPREHQADQWIADKACDYIQNYSDDKPFAMMVGFVSPHCPYDADKNDKDLFSEEDMPKPKERNEESDIFREAFLKNYMSAWCGVDYSDFNDAQKAKMRQYYSGLIHKVDECVGQLIDTLKAKGIYDDTVIIFSSDHGDLVGDYGYIGKHVFYEPSIRVPMIIKDNSLTPANKDDLVSLTDVRATMLHIAGVENCETTDSVCLSCYKENSGNRGILGATDLGVMYCTDDFKLCRYQQGLVQLFDRKNDPDETVNLAYNPDYLDALKEIDGRLQGELINAMVLANNEKSVNHTITLDPGAFFKRNWQRPYPNV